MLSRTAENYLRMIYELEERKGYARPGDISRVLGISAPSVTQMLQKLAGQRLIDHEKGGEVTLTEKGRKRALAIKERYGTFLKLLQMAGVRPATAFVDACVMENSISKETAAKLAEFIERLERTQLCKKL